MSIPDHEINTEKLTELLEIKDERIKELEAENRRVVEGAAMEGQATENELAPALGYEYSEEYGWVTGDHSGTTLAMEARGCIAELEARIKLADDLAVKAESYLYRGGSRSHLAEAVDAWRDVYPEEAMDP